MWRLAQACTLLRQSLADACASTPSRTRAQQCLAELSVCGGGVRAYSSSAQAAAQSIPTAVRPFLAQNAPTPPVQFVEGMPPPTALAWLRRRGPEIPQGALHKAFRKEQVRVFDGQRVKRVRASRVLNQGDVLLYPKEMLSLAGMQEESEQDSHYKESFRHTAPLHSRTTSPYQSPASPTPYSYSKPLPTQNQLHSYSNPFPTQKQSYSNPFPTQPRSPASHPHSRPEAQHATHAHKEQEEDTSPLHHHQQQQQQQRQEQQQQQQQEQQLPSTHHSLRAAADQAPTMRHSYRQDSDHRSPLAHHFDSSSSDSEDPFVPGKAFGGQPLTPSLVRSWVLGYTKELVFINKPFGLMVQGYKNTLEAMMDPALKVEPGDDTPRLVHRLDRNVSGVMAVARSAHAAAWMAACFRDKAAQVTQRNLLLQRKRDLDERRRHKSLLLYPPPAALEREVPEGMSVKRVYWAIVSSRDLPKGKEGRMRAQVVDQGGQNVAALTYFRVRQVSDGLAWVELTPQTGRRHQLRNHCARVLKAPIVGDVRYGFKGVTPSKSLTRALPPSFWTTFSPRTAETVLHPPNRKERRQAAAAAWALKTAADKNRLPHFEEEEGSGSEIEEENEGEREEDGDGEGLEGMSLFSSRRSSLRQHGMRDQLSTAAAAAAAGGGGVSSEVLDQMSTAANQLSTEAEDMRSEALSQGEGSVEDEGEAVQESRAQRLWRTERELPLLLHARSLIIERPGKKKTLKVTAPLPPYMAAVFSALGWPLPAP